MGVVKAWGLLLCYSDLCSEEPSPDAPSRYWWPVTGEHPADPLAGGLHRSPATIRGSRCAPTCVDMTLGLLQAGPCERATPRVTTQGPS